MRIAICDDEQSDIQIITKHINVCAKELKDEILCVSFLDGNVLLNNLDEKWDAIFLDIDMPVPNGLEIANIIYEKYPDLNIIFVTNRVDLVFEVIKFRPLGFVRKNNIEVELREALLRVQKEMHSKSIIYHNTMKNSTIKIKTDDITYLESKGHNIEIHTKDSIQIIRSTMGEYEQKLKKYGFVRIHKGFIVNMKYISQINGRKIKLDDGTELTVGGSYVDNMRGAYAKYISKKYCI